MFLNPDMSQAPKVSYRNLNQSMKLLVSHNFPRPKVTSSNCLFCPTNSPKTKDSSSTVRHDKDRQQIFTCMKHFWLHVKEKERSNMEKIEKVKNIYSKKKKLNYRERKVTLSYWGNGTKRRKKKVAAWGQESESKWQKRKETMKAEEGGEERKDARKGKRWVEEWVMSARRWQPETRQELEDSMCPHTFHATGWPQEDERLPGRMERERERQRERGGRASTPCSGSSSRQF